MSKPSHRKYLKSPSMKGETFKAVIGFILILLFIFAISSFFVNDGNNSNSNTGGNEDNNRNLITFTIGNDTLQAEKGMTWSQLLADPKYNKGFDQTGEYITISTGAHILYLCMKDGTGVKLSDTILEGGVYYFSTLPPDPDIGGDGEGDNSNKIFFYIGATKYFAENGMTWSEWIDSDYDSGPYVLSDDNISSGGRHGGLVYTSDGNIVLKDDLIDDGAIYRLIIPDKVDPTPDPDPDTGEDDNPNIITFTIGDDTLQAESGMTWSQWLIDHKDNIGFDQNGEYITITTGAHILYLCMEDGTRVKPSDMILEGGVYNFSNV